MPQSLAQIYLHIIFSTKERRAFLQNAEIRRELHSYLAGVAREKDSPPVAIDGTADHVHILLKLSRTETISDVVRDLKRANTKWLRARDPQFELFSWQSGYGAFSVSASNLEKVKVYIAGQEEHHRKISFQEELLSFLKKHGVEYDKRHLWD